MKAVELANYMFTQGRLIAAENLGYAPTTLDKLARRGAVVIDGTVYAPVTKRRTRQVGADNQN